MAPVPPPILQRYEDAALASAEQEIEAYALALHTLAKLGRTHLPVEYEHYRISSFNSQKPFGPSWTDKTIQETDEDKKARWDKRFSKDVKNQQSRYGAYVAVTDEQKKTLSPDVAKQLDKAQKNAHAAYNALQNKIAGYAVDTVERLYPGDRPTEESGKSGAAPLMRALRRRSILESMQASLERTNGMLPVSAQPLEMVESGGLSRQDMTERLFLHLGKAAENKVDDLALTPLIRAEETHIQTFARKLMKDQKALFEKEYNRLQRAHRQRVRDHRDNPVAADLEKYMQLHMQRLAESRQQGGDRLMLQRAEDPDEKTLREKLELIARRIGTPEKLVQKVARQVIDDAKLQVDMAEEARAELGWHPRTQWEPRPDRMHWLEQPDKVKSAEALPLDTPRMEPQDKEAVPGGFKKRIEDLQRQGQRGQDVSTPVSNKELGGLSAPTKLVAIPKIPGSRNFDA